MTVRIDERRAQLGRARLYLGQLSRTNDAIADAAAEAVARGGWLDGVKLDEDAAKILANWRDRLRGCSKQVRLRACGAGHGVQVESNCCQVPCCPRLQRRRSAAWIARAARLWKELPNEPGKVGRRWKMITISVRRSGDLVVDVDAVTKLRKALMRHLANQYGSLEIRDGEERARIDGFGAVELSDGGYVHLHVLAYSLFVPRPELMVWLRGRTCTLDGCPHPADDRCEACRAARTSCDHPDGARSRCNGSWYCDLRPVTREGGLVEALKYAAAPVELEAKDVRRRKARAAHPLWPHEETTDAQLAYAERLLRFYLALYKRHRVETYGLARPHEPADGPGEVAPGVTDEATLRGHGCPTCGAYMRVVVFGERLDTPGYTWSFYDSA